MIHLLHLHLKPTVTSDELVQIADLLERWSNDCMDLFSCEGDVEDTVLNDLNSGERPKSQYLRFGQILEKMGEAAAILELPPIDPGPHRLKQLEAEMEARDSKNSFVLLVRSSSEDGAPLDAIKTLRERLKDIDGVDRIEEKEVLEDDDEEDDEEVFY